VEAQSFNGMTGTVLDEFEDAWGVELPVALEFAEASSPDFELTLGIPEPATLSLLGVGALTLLRRRRVASS
jgi:hypothetical protein